MYKLISKRVKTGFVFDSAPAINNQSVAILKLNEKLSLNDLNKNQQNYDNDGITNNNLLIIGENYDALKNLLLVYKNKIDVIYIDPPYNTDASINEKNNLSEDKIAEKSSNKFVYRDKFSRTGWLNMMQDRLYMARDLLADDGVIFISIDDNEQAYLKVLMDDIFGEENFIANLARETKTGGGRFGKQYIQKDLDYIICFSKNLNLTKEFKKIESKWDDYKLCDNRGKYVLKHPLDGGAGNEKYTQKLTINGRDYFPRTNWSFSEKRIKFMLDNDFLVPKENGFIYVKNYKEWEIGEKNNKYVIKKKEQGVSWSSLKLIDKKYNNASAISEIKQIFNSKSTFSYPKPTKLILDLINMIDNKNSIVLDFFAGSGTTGQAVMELNKEDGGNRKFILCTNDEEIKDNKGIGTGKYIAKDVTYERLYRIIKGIGTKGEKDFEWIKKNNPYKTSNLKVFDINYHNISINDDLEPIINEVRSNMKLININFSCDEKDIVYKLSSLRPLKKEIK